MEHNNINPTNPSHGHDDPRARDGRVLRHLLTARDRSVFDRNMAMMRALEAGEPVTGVAKRYGVTRQWLHGLRRRHAEEGGGAGAGRILMVVATRPCDCMLY